MSGWLELGAGCALISATSTVNPTDAGWQEEVVYELLSKGGCKVAALHYDAGTRFTELGGKRLLGDGTRGKLGPERFDIASTGLDAATTVTVLLPELLTGDRAEVRTVHEWTSDGAYRWQPGRSGAAWSELVAGKDANLTLFGKVEVDRRKGVAWTTESVLANEVQVASAHTPEAPTLGAVATAGMSVDEALAAMDELLLAPRSLDASVISGDAALDRGSVDDRGWARTLVALTAGGPDKVELGWRMPEHARPAATEDALAEVAVVHTENGPVPLVHPSTPSWSGNVHTESTHQAMSWTQAAPPDAPPRILLNRELTLSWEGDPAYELAPGRKSRVDAVDELNAVADQASLVVVPVPTEVDHLEVSGEGARSWQVPGSVLVAIDRGAERVIKLTWGHPDAPTYGEKPSFAGLDVDMQVRADGKVRWEDGAWWLAAAEGTTLLPSREALLYALEYRFGVASYPEPGLPALLRGRSGSGWEVIEDFRSGISDRARPGRLILDPLWPRKLMRARRHGVLTDVEAMLMATRWAQQLQFQASWVLVRPASEGPGATVAPTGYDFGLVRVVHDNELRWIDPACTVCGPWEIRPDLEGAAALGWEVSETPAPTPGSLTVRDREGAHEYTLSGSAALSLRLALLDAVGPDRAATLAHWLSDGGVVTATEGLGEAGADVKLTIEGGSPRLWPADSEGPVWMGWVGPRAWPSEGPDGEYVGDAVTWRRKTTDKGLTVEVLDVRDRRVSAEERAAVDAARAALPDAAPDAPVDGEPTATEDDATPTDGDGPPSEDTSSEDDATPTESDAPLSEEGPAEGTPSE
ncbi:MAG: hypothetical protein EP330_05670 [Deltaproteobacteria bacterium]|nr:MAG: hypothetical protein EP330_05670 [Deltaproteobacteria bacterium]